MWLKIKFAKDKTKIIPAQAQLKICAFANTTKYYTKHSKLLCIRTTSYNEPKLMQTIIICCFGRKASGKAWDQKL